MACYGDSFTFTFYIYKMIEVNVCFRKSRYRSCGVRERGKDFKVTADVPEI
jgi:hypothetical protein